MSAALDDLFGEVVTRKVELLKFPTSVRAPGLTVAIVRRGTPNSDMSGVDVTKRAVSIVATTAGNLKAIEVHMDADMAADLADALDEAAATIRGEQP